MPPEGFAASEMQLYLKLLSDTPQIAPVDNGGRRPLLQTPPQICRLSGMSEVTLGTWKPERTFGPGLSVGERMMGVSANLLKVVVFGRGGWRL